MKLFSVDRLYEVPGDAFDDDYVEEPLAEVSGFMVRSSHSLRTGFMD